MSGIIQSPPDSARLTPAERALLAECEAVVARDLHAFVAVGNALVTIRDKRLYRATHKTFELYTRELFDFSARRAYQLAEGAAIVKALADANNCSHLPEREAHVRPLLKVTPARRPVVWQKALQNAAHRTVTARDVSWAVRGYGQVPPVHYNQKYGRDLLPRTATDAERRKLDRLIGTWSQSGKNVRPAFQKFLARQQGKANPAP